MSDHFADFFLPDPIIPTPAPAVCGTDALKEGLAWLTDELKASAASPVVYQSGSDQIALCATYGPKLLKLDDGQGGIRMEWTDMDFLIPAADLILNGRRFEPKRGDQVIVNTGEAVETFEMFPFGNEPPWRWSDPHRSMVRVHTKRISTEPV